MIIIGMFSRYFLYSYPKLYKSWPKTCTNYTGIKFIVNLPILYNHGLLYRNKSNWIKCLGPYLTHTFGSCPKIQKIWQARNIVLMFFRIFNKLFEDHFMTLHSPYGWNFPSRSYTWDWLPSPPRYAWCTWIYHSLAGEPTTRSL